jgi:ribosomal protein S18 acetylase RimI-like enzyme
VLVRRAGLDDTAALAEVHVQTWRAAYEHVFGAERLAAIDVAGRERIARRFVEGDQFDYFLAEDAEGICGFVATGPADAEDETRRELYAIYVLPRAWGSPAATRLMSAALEAARARGEKAVILWVLEDNPRARRFYEREGWREEGTGETEYLGVTARVVLYAIAI